jgi:1-aminocyclopropane-1-carboxylate deaminase/D-cysteine desulfhydrase-like pyridoxal-dependent ACC family enzyme
MPLEIVMFPEEVIQLNRELATGLHPKLEAILSEVPGDHDFVERIAHIAAYCEIILDSMYDENELAGLCELLRKRLVDKRERPDTVIEVKHVH